MQLETKSTAPQQNMISRPSPKQGLLFVLSAPSGAGKDTVIHALKDQGMDFYVVASVTTRAPRPGESEGNPYYFVSEDTFQHMVAHNELLEHAKVHGNWYGQPLQQIRNNLQAGRDVLLKIDVQGAATVRQKIPGAIFIFLVPGSVEELVERLTTRHTETEDEKALRLINAQKELAQQEHYEYVIVNRQGRLAEAVEQLKAIIVAEHCRTKPRYITI
ncbi:MAG TPA: guanylate kinase [Ktedonosporobacter sp.]|nr:guanylate kinase [Ktedonosporobacter sp.]